jgi:hypothetical protein
MIIIINDTKISLHTLFNLNLLTELCEALLFLYRNIITNLKTQEKSATVDDHSQKNRVGDVLTSLTAKKLTLCSL